MRALCLGLTLLACSGCAVRMDVCALGACGAEAAQIPPEVVGLVERLTDDVVLEPEESDEPDEPTESDEPASAEP